MRHDNLLAESRRQAGRSPAGGLGAPLAVEPHCIWAKVLAGLREHDVPEGHHPTGYIHTTVVSAATGGEGHR